METAARSKWSPLVEHLRRVFGDRLEAVVAYGRDGRLSSLAVVQSIDADDLATCARLVSQWHTAGLRTPLLVTSTEFARSLDAFPLEYAEVQQTAQVVHGYNPFDRFGTIKAIDLRRACEVQINSHLLHIREDYLDCGGSPRAVAGLVAESAPAFAMILRQLAQLDGRAAITPRELGEFGEERIGLDARVVGDVLATMDPSAAGTVDGARVFPAYLTALDQLARFVDKWISV